MKAKILILILIISALAKLKADDYYDIPAGWEKLYEFENAYGVNVLAENNQILIFGNTYMYSYDNGKTFNELNKNVYTDRGFTMFYHGKLFTGKVLGPNGWYFIRYDLQKNTFDSVNISPWFSSELLEIKVNELDSTLIAKFKISGSIHSADSHLCLISRDGGDNWEFLDLKRVSNYNFYEILFDKRTKGRWIYKVTNTDTDNSNAPDMVFLTEDNGKSFTELVKPNLNMDLLYNTSNNDNNLSLDYNNSVSR